MNTEALREYLSGIVARNVGLDEKFYDLVCHIESKYFELCYSSSTYSDVVMALQVEWPDRSISGELEGGCGSCGWGESVVITVWGAPPWLCA